jgi:hypothetical protein
MYALNPAGINWSVPNTLPSFPCGGGLGCAGMGGLTMDGSGLFGTGIFGTGVTVTDLSSWGIGEVLTVAVAAFAVFSMVSTTKQTATAVRKRGRKLRQRFAGGEA